MAGTSASSAICLSISAFEEENFALRSLRFLERDLHLEWHDFPCMGGTSRLEPAKLFHLVRKVTSGLSTSIAIWADVLALLSPDPAAFPFCRPRRANEKLNILWRVRKTAGKVNATRAAADDGEGSMIGTSDWLGVREGQGAASDLAHRVLNLSRNLSPTAVHPANGLGLVEGDFGSGGQCSRGKSSDKSAIFRIVCQIKARMTRAGQQVGEGGEGSQVE